MYLHKLLLIIQVLPRYHPSYQQRQTQTRLSIPAEDEFAQILQAREDTLEGGVGTCFPQLYQTNTGRAQSPGRPDTNLPGDATHIQTDR